MPAGVAGDLTDGGGPCPGTVGYLFVGTLVAVPFSQITNDFSGSYCLGFTVDTTSTNTEPLLRFYDGLGSEIGSLNISSSSIVYTLGGQTVVFSPVDIMDFQNFQLCQEGNTLTIYQGCVALGSQGPFSFSGFSESDTLVIFRDVYSADGFQVSCSCKGIYTPAIFLGFLPHREHLLNSTSSTFLDLMLYRERLLNCNVIQRVTPTNHPLQYL